MANVVLGTLNPNDKVKDRQGSLGYTRKLQLQKKNHNKKINDSKSDFRPGYSSLLMYLKGLVRLNP